MVTGGAGFIGSHLCDALVARGHRVTCVDNLVATSGSARNVAHLLGHPRFDLIAEDVLTWCERAPLAGVDCVFHLAASKNSVCMEDPERDLAVNGLGTLRLLRASARGGIRKFVHASTGSVLGELRERHDEKAPVSYYGVSKLAAESYCHVVGATSGLDYTVLRYYHVIGPRQDSSARGGVVPIFVRQALEGVPLTIEGDGKQTRSFTSVNDAVRANLIAMERTDTAGATLTCASGTRVTIEELAEYVLARTGSRAGVHHLPARVGDIRHFAVDNTALRRLGLAFDMDWRATVRDVIAELSSRSAA